MGKLRRGAVRIALIVASTGLGFGLYAAVFLASSRASAAQQALSRKFDAAAMALVAGLSDRPAELTGLLGIHEDDETNRAELRRFIRLSPLLWYGEGENPATRLSAAYEAWRRAVAVTGVTAKEREAAAIELAAAYIEAGRLLDHAGARVRISFDVTFLFLSFLLSMGAAAGVSMLARLRESRLKDALAHETFLRALRAEEETRKAVAMELHDDLAQDVAAAKMLCERAAACETTLARRAADILGETNKKIRRLSSELRPPELDAFGLCAALKAICDEAGRRFDFPLRYEGPHELRRFDEELELGVYRIMREAASNAAKYAKKGGGVLRCELGDEGGYPMLSVSLRDEGWEEDPYGFRAAPGPQADPIRGAGLGLNAMRERARAIGAELSIELRQDGSTVALRLRPDGRRPAERT